MNPTQWVGALLAGLITALKPYYETILAFISGFVVESLRQDAKDAQNAAQEAKGELDAVKTHEKIRAYNAGLTDDVARARLRNLH